MPPNVAKGGTGESSGHSCTGQRRLDPTEAGTAPGKTHAQKGAAESLPRGAPPTRGRHTSDGGNMQGTRACIRNGAISLPTRGASRKVLKRHATDWGLASKRTLCKRPVCSGKGKPTAGHRSASRRLFCFPFQYPSSLQIRGLRLPCECSPTRSPVYAVGCTALLDSEARRSTPHTWSPRTGPSTSPTPPLRALPLGSPRRPGGGCLPGSTGRSGARPPSPGGGAAAAPRHQPCARGFTSMASRCRLRGGRARCPLGSPRPPGRGCGAQGKGAAARRLPRSGLRAARPCARARGRGRPGVGGGGKGWGAGEGGRRSGFKFRRKSKQILSPPRAGLGRGSRDSINLPKHGDGTTAWPLFLAKFPPDPGL